MVGFHDGDGFACLGLVELVEHGISLDLLNLPP
jgi:hypothetical protein